MPNSAPNEPIAALVDLQREIERLIRETSIHLGPGGTDQLAADLTVRTCVWVAKNAMPRTPGLAALMAEIDTERQRQLAKWGDQHHPDGTGITGDDERAASARHACQSMAERDLVTWRDIAHEEHLEALAESDPAKLRAELIQDIAVKCAWIADIDSRGDEQQ
ncbi:NUDIX hydrolase [Streptomyces sp. NPDC006551]|uniref:NUDIX hydrolase n=1 Tax=Streptomyces sp. NPDC006551 TaxID=3157178 RepID=UPI0033A7C122